MKHNWLSSLSLSFERFTEFIIRLFTETKGQKRDSEKAAEEFIKEQEYINKLIGLPPPDKFAEKNPYRFM